MFDQQRVRAFVGPRAEERAERVGNFFKAMAGQEAARKWCIENKIGLVKATAETVGTTGGFLAPDDFDSAVINIRERVGAFRQGAEVRPVTSMSNLRPRRVGGLTASFVAEGAPIPESSFQLDAVQATERKMAILARSSSELWEDEAVGLGEFITSEIAYAFAAVEDDCGFNGDGTSVYSGIRGLGTILAGTRSAVAAASAHNTFLTLDATDIANLMAGVMASAIPGARWYVSALGYAQTFCRLAAVSGGLTATQRPDGTIDASYLGFPVSMSLKLPNVATTLATKPMMFFGNLAMSSVIVERSNQTIVAMSEQRALDQDQILTRGVQRMDLINHMGTGGDGTSVGPVAMLVGTA
jgi:HK97 family phage major capsid protein